MACFSARYLALLRRFPNQMQSNASLIMPAPDAEGALVFAESHNHHYLIFHDPAGFSNGIYEFELPEEFFEAIGPRHMGTAGGRHADRLRLALSNGEYRLYEGTENDRIFDSGADEAVTFTWSGRISRAREELRNAFDAILFLHQSGNAVPVTQTLSPTYFSEVDFIRGQLSGDDAVLVGHRWLRLPDDSVRCLTQFSAGKGEPDHVHALVCVDSDMALG
jgi:hypothetical protein